MSDNRTAAERLAAAVETDRAEREATVEADRVSREDAIEVTRSELAVLLEADRKAHNLRLEERVRLATRRTTERFLALYLIIILIFGLLAYRTEVNANALAQGFYQACLARQNRQIQANVGRETLVQIAANGPTAPTDQAAKDQLIKQLRDALLLPVEDCGTAP